MRHEELKLQAGKWYETRDGRKAYVGYIRDDEYSAIGHDHDGAANWAMNGRYWYAEIHPRDLIKEIKPKRVYDAFLNIYPCGIGCAYNTKEDALCHRHSQCIATIHIKQEYEEGEGLT